jgi:hypothetical protein
VVSAGPGLSSLFWGLCWALHHSRLSPSPEDRQMAEQIAQDTRKREQFQRLKEQFVKDQEVGGLGSGWFWLLESLI